MDTQRRVEGVTTNNKEGIVKLIGIERGYNKNNGVRFPGDILSAKRLQYFLDTHYFPLL